jgi:hypothetical protein
MHASHRVLWFGFLVRVVRQKGQLNARVGTVGTDVRGVYALKAKAEDSAKVSGDVRGASNDPPGFKWTTQP